MTTRNFAMVVGAVFVLAGVLGFVPVVVSPPATEAPDVSVTAGYGYLLGLFPINVLHNLVHLGIGLWGLGASRSALSSQSFARGLAVFYGALAVMGVIPVLNTTFGLIPIFGHDIWLHALTAAAAAYFSRAGTAAEIPAERMTRRAS